MRGKQERVSRDWVVEAPPVIKMVRKTALQDGKNRNKSERVEDVIMVGGYSAPNKNEYLMDRIVDRSNEKGRWRFKVRCYGFASTNDTWERIEILPRSIVMRYL